MSVGIFNRRDESVASEINMDISETKKDLERIYRLKKRKQKRNERAAYCIFWTS